MRRFSQRNSLVTLNEINITPLLDLAFVLLIIFIITTPLLEKSIELNLPHGGQAEKQLDKKDIATVEITANGVYALNKQRMSLSQLLGQLAQDSRANPNLVVYIRGDKNGLLDYTAQLIDGCQRNGIKRYSLRTDPTQK
jgi:biopolymer transport protein ExbD